MSDPPPTLLAVFAHPDDESFRCGGALALLARRGVHVHLLTSTRGQAGSCGDPPLCRPEDLGPLRERELRCACDALGIMTPILLDYQDGALPAVDEEEAVARVLAVMRAIRPQALLTWPPDGLSGHPDHVAVSRWTTLAYERASDWGADAPVATYHLAVPRSVAEALGLSHLHTVPDDEITLSVDVAPAWEHKVAALLCHRTQLGASPILTAPPERQRLFLGSEHFQRVLERPGPDCFRLLEEA